VVSAYLHSVRAVIKAEKRDVAVDGFVKSVSVREMGNMTGDKFEEYFTSGRRRDSAV